MVSIFDTYEYYHRINSKLCQNENIDKRNFLVCDCCYWCSSYLPDLENENDDYIDNCPVCNEKIKACSYLKINHKG